jgi:hypothetical protein
VQRFAKPPNYGSEGSNPSLTAIWKRGRVWFMVAVLKTVDGNIRGFESYRFRHGVVRPAVRTAICGIANSGSNPEHHPKY